MRAPFQRFFASVVSESGIEGTLVASGVVTPNSAPATEACEQTEMLTRSRRRKRASGTGEAPVAAERPEPR